MKERPILLNGDMVRAILDGRKTQTRRLINPQPFNGVSDEEAIKQIGGLPPRLSLHQVINQAWRSGCADIPCPLGKPDDRLWVRETHHLSHQKKVTYRADYPFNPFNEDECGEDCSMVGEKWRPSIHMPRWASRITLEITAIRIQRIQNISEEDAIAEGVLNSTLQAPPTKTVMYHCGPWPTPICGESARDAYGALWESTYGKDSWDQNPWVWVIEFRRVEHQAEAAA
ncbi:hypothetical protein MJO52_03020 [Microbulbifer variabilis]|uniref:Morphogenetic protein n=1 Tax=Microbulbifer variabilis TaxID=266805 RepID=A0ABY4VCT8_9GAMM|nr:hypothetical protein [Microbulbifer variabilis]USD22121.1 hypothetical protein MJO52_03020 [Microbulbifer variabilis]